MRRSVLKQLGNLLQEKRFSINLKNSANGALVNCALFNPHNLREKTSNCDRKNKRKSKQFYRTIV
jgi:hypothetical protein